jgi:hypothetical protein
MAEYFNGALGDGVWKAAAEMLQIVKHVIEKRALGYLQMKMSM